MTAQEYINSLPPDRKAVISKLRQMILKADPLVREVVGLTMGREALIYMQGDIFKYALASGKEYMSLHSMVLYGSKTLHDNFRKMMPKVRFQKGCLNFKSTSQLSLPLAEKLIKEMAKIAYPPPEYKARMEKLAVKAKQKREEDAATDPGIAGKAVPKTKTVAKRK
jgi:hypothetical protein